MKIQYSVKHMDVFVHAEMKLIMHSNASAKLVCILTQTKYCKCRYFSWGKISWKCESDCSCGGNFHDYSAIPGSMINVIMVLFACGGNVRNWTIIAKNRKITPIRKCPRLQYFCYRNEASLTFHTLQLKCVWRCTFSKAFHIFYK